MIRKAIRFRNISVPIGVILLWIVLSPFLSAQIKYPETIAVLEAAYRGEIQAHYTYMAYAEKANLEGYPNIGNMFIALATSESIHARNFKRLLSDLGIKVKVVQNVEIGVGSTKENLKKATEVELNEIDTQYPQFIQQIEMENHEAAICNITFAWKSEKQHRDLIQKIQSGTGIFFGVLANEIEKSSMEHFVCGNCGSTLKELLKENCPICGGSVLEYKKIKNTY